MTSVVKRNAWPDVKFIEIVKIVRQCFWRSAFQRIKQFVTKISSYNIQNVIPKMEFLNIARKANFIRGP